MSLSNAGIQRGKSHSGRCYTLNCRVIGQVDEHDHLSIAPVLRNNSMKNLLFKVIPVAKINCERLRVPPTLACLAICEASCAASKRISEASVAFSMFSPSMAVPVWINSCG